MIIQYSDYSKISPDKKASYEAVLGEAYDKCRISQVLPDYLYVVFRAVTANIPNMNADQFDSEELDRYDDIQAKKVYETFNGRSIFTNHQSSKVENSIGVIFDSNFVTADPNDQFVEIVFGVDRQKAGDIARGIETNRLNSGSMGCAITHSICSACGATVMTEKDFCPCLKDHRGMIFKGKRVAEKLRGVNFQEYSIVTVGADPRAKLRYIVSAVIDYKRLPKAAEESDIFGLMKLIAHEVKGASFEEKVRLDKNLDTVIASIEGVNLKPCIAENSVNLTTSIDNKLSALFTYTINSYKSDLPGKISRPISNDDLINYIGKEVECDSAGRIYVL